MSGRADPLEALRPYVDNPLPPLTTLYVAGVLGDHPSTYSRSPAMWNAAFAAMGLPVTYLPFDVAPGQLDGFLAASRTLPALLGLNVTVPYKDRMASHLSDMDKVAAASGAVNTVLRTAEGKFAGANTDGAAALAVLRQEWGFGSSARGGPRLLLLGAGGAARAVGVAAGTVRGVEVLVAARRPERAAAAVDAVKGSGGKAAAVDESALDQILPDVDVIVNATPVGMAGPIRTGSGVTWLEPFSALAPATPPISAAEGTVHDRPASPQWWERAWPGITINLEISLRRALRLRSDARMLDLIYAPAESVTLKHLRWTGHEARNGDRVLVHQAVDAFLLVTRDLLAEEGERLRPAVAAAMTAAEVEQD